MIELLEAVTNNNVVALFMGASTKEHPKDGTIYKWNRPEPLVQAMDGLSAEPSWMCGYTMYELKYHQSWNWLMPVVKKLIERQGTGGKYIDSAELTESLLNADLDSTYRLLCEAIITHRLYKSESAQK